MEDFAYAANHGFSEIVVSNAPFLSRSGDIEEFFDANMDQFSDSSEVGFSIYSRFSLFSEQSEVLFVQIRSMCFACFDFSEHPNSKQSFLNSDVFKKNYQESQFPITNRLGRSATYF